MSFGEKYISMIGHQWSYYGQHGHISGVVSFYRVTIGRYVLVDVGGCSPVAW